MRVAIILTGDEIVEGRIQDSNGPFLARHFRALNHEIVGLRSVGDDLEEIKSALSDFIGRVDLVLTSGGLGGTLDDLTRPAMAAVFSRPLEIRSEALAHIEATWLRAGRDPSGRSNPEAHLPQGARLLPNPVGLALGFEMTDRGTRVQCYPGVPGELRTMIDLEFPAANHASLERIVHVAGWPESKAAEALGDRLERGRETLYGISAKEGYLALSLRAACVESLARELTFLRALFGAAIFSEDGVDLDRVIFEKLVGRGQTLSCAESLTGGWLGHRLTEFPGASAVFLGTAVGYSNAAKSELLGVPQEFFGSVGAVSREVATAMAQGAQGRFGSDWAIATTGIAGPDGGSAEKPVGLAWVALAGPDGLIVAESRRHPGNRRQIKERSARHALDLLRRSLEGGPQEVPKY